MTDTESPQGSAASRLLTAVASNGVGQAISAVQAFLLVPLFLRAWGGDGYGRWLSVTAVIYYLALLDLGGQSHFQNLLTTAYARGDRSQFRASLSEGVSLFVVVASLAWLAMAATFLGVAAIPSARSMGLGPMTPWILALLGTSLLITMPAGIYATAYRATGRFTRIAMLANWFRLAELATSAAVLAIRCTPLQFAIMTLAWTVVRTAYITWDVGRTVPDARGVQLSLEAARQGRTHLRASLLFWLYGLASALNQQGVLIVLGIVSAPAVVATFSTHRTAAGLVNYVGALLIGPLWPELARLRASERFADLRRASLMAIRIVMILSGLTAIAIFVALPTIYPRWTGRVLSLQAPLLVVLLVQTVLAAGWSTAAWPLLAGSRPRALATWSVANALLTLVLAYWLGGRLGALGAAVASLTGDVLCGLFVFPVLAARFLAAPAREMIGALALPTGAIGLVAAAVATIRFVPGIPGLIGAVAFCCASAALAYRLAHSSGVTSFALLRRFTPDWLS